MKLLLVDCDSTLSALEGIDELARLRGPEVFQQVEEATRQAMDGTISIDSIFARRLEVIRPTRQDCEAIGQDYIKHEVPGVREALDRARELGWTVAILSGGFVPCIEPLAAELGIERIEAVPLFFDEAGEYVGFGEDYPTTRNGGKVEVVEKLREEWKPEQIVMVGDGVSDLETKPAVDHFIGFGAVVVRPKVHENADSFLMEWAGLEEVLARV
ncbi:HAD family hydrolase [Phragmitibacter flavus]|uniref:phosphoserine phosphatase n=1 Tax=Phragmitibacter flavus TaxID=2576071 RepID=A0A5R8KEA3_9BACT|nr:HAD-IB family phosphatase [Phragmitibacter flavus]TLD70610.1 HAD family hydrolase [Phragmitibacter flavus]